MGIIVLLTAYIIMKLFTDSRLRGSYFQTDLALKRSILGRCPLKTPISMHKLAYYSENGRLCLNEHKNSPLPLFYELEIR